jgi:hypothetical protein
MNDKKRLVILNSAISSLKKTGQGHIQWVKEGKEGGHWKEAMTKLTVLSNDLKPHKPPSKIPDLGPILSGSVKSILNEDFTHITDALGWPAFDIGFGDIGRGVIAPEDVEVYDNTSSSQGGDAFYIEGESGLKYWVAHIVAVPSLGKVFKKGMKMTTIAKIARPHSHWGIDARPVIGKHLESHDDYTHGGPTLREQLTKALI